MYSARRYRSAPFGAASTISANSWPAAGTGTRAPAETRSGRRSPDSAGRSPRARCRAPSPHPRASAARAPAGGCPGSFASISGVARRRLPVRRRRHDQCGAASSGSSPIHELHRQPVQQLLIRRAARTACRSSPRWPRCPCRSTPATRGSRSSAPSWATAGPPANAQMSSRFGGAPAGSGCRNAGVPGVTARRVAGSRRASGCGSRDARLARSASTSCERAFRMLAPQRRDRVVLRAPFGNRGAPVAEDRVAPAPASAARAGSPESRARLAGTGSATGVRRGRDGEPDAPQIVVLVVVGIRAAVVLLEVEIETCRPRCAIGFSSTNTALRG